MTLVLGSVTFGPTKTDAEVREWRRIHETTQSLLGGASAQVQMCNCRGPQSGEKLCPCALSADAMKGAGMIANGVTISGRKYRLVPEDVTP